MGLGCQAATVDSGGRGVLGAHALDLVFLSLSLTSLQAHTCITELQVLAPRRWPTQVVSLLFYLRVSTARSQMPSGGFP